MKIKKVFKKKPTRWGLRGDDVLWDKLCESIGDLNMPKDVTEFRVRLSLAYKEITGYVIGTGGDFFVESLKSKLPGGMSSGYVCSEWWLTIGVPFLVDQATSLINKKAYKPCWEPYLTELSYEQWDEASYIQHDVFFPTKLKAETPKWIVERYKVEHPEYEKDLDKFYSKN